MALPTNEPRNAQGTNVGPAGTIRPGRSPFEHLERALVERLLIRLRENPIREELVSALKARIGAGTYEDEHKLDIVVDRLLDVLSAETPPILKRALIGGAAEGLVGSRRRDGNVLHQLIGRVNAVRDDVAYVSLVDVAGREADAACDREELAVCGIGEGMRFSCTFVRRGNETTMRLSPLIPRPLTQAEILEADTAVDECGGAYDPATDR